MPATNSMRVKPFARSHERTAIMPTSPVRYACVPPHGVRSKPSISIKRRSPSRAGSFRNGSSAASSDVTLRIVIARSSQTTLFASSTARSIISVVGLFRSTSISHDVSSTRKLLVGALKRFMKACERMCWPVCCCMWSNRRDQSTRPCITAPRAGVIPWTTCNTPLSPSSMHSTTRAPLSVPVSLGCPPPVG